MSDYVFLADEHAVLHLTLPTAGLQGDDHPGVEHGGEQWKERFSQCAGLIDQTALQQVGVGGGRIGGRFVARCQL